MIIWKPPSKELLLLVVFSLNLKSRVVFKSSKSLLQSGRAELQKCHYLVLCGEFLQISYDLDD